MYIFDVPIQWEILNKWQESIDVIMKWEAQSAVFSTPVFICFFTGLCLKLLHQFINILDLLIPLVLVEISD